MSPITKVTKGAEVLEMVGHSQTHLCLVVCVCASVCSVPRHTRRVRPTRCRIVRPTRLYASMQAHDEFHEHGKDGKPFSNTGSSSELHHTTESFLPRSVANLLEIRGRARVAQVSLLHPYNMLAHCHTVGSQEWLLLIAHHTPSIRNCGFRNLQSAIFIFLAPGSVE